MSKKRNKTSSEGSSGGFERLFSSSADFYSSSPTENPLTGDSVGSNPKQTRITSRHQVVKGHRSDKMDPREKMALMAILKSMVMIILLVIAFFMLKKGISLYEESIWLEHANEGEGSPVLQEVVMVEDFDIQDPASHEKFSERIQTWKEAERLVRSADGRSYAKLKKTLPL